MGSVLLALSIYGLGDLLSPLEREGCRLADAGCSAAAQFANSGGKLDALLSILGVVLFVLAGVFLASAIKPLPPLCRWGWPPRGGAAFFVVIAVATGLGTAVDLSGLFERLLAATGATSIALLAAGVLQRS